MNRQLNQRDSSESLELMLDVLSNVFGGVILICCLLAILPRHSNPPPLSPVESARSQMLERRIDSAQSQLEDMRQKVADLTDATDSDLVKVLSGEGATASASRQRGLMVSVTEAGCLGYFISHTHTAPGRSPVASVRRGSGKWRRVQR